MLKKLWDWLVTSSVDPSKTALTVKAVLLGVVPFLLVVSNGLGLHSITSGSLQNIIDIIEELIQYGLGLFSMAIGIYGLGRKLVLTIEGLNQN